MSSPGFRLPGRWPSWKDHQRSLSIACRRQAKTNTTTTGVAAFARWLETPSQRLFKPLPTSTTRPFLRLLSLRNAASTFLQGSDAFRVERNELHPLGRNIRLLED